MKKLRTSYPTGYKGVQDLPVYKKAVEIFSISRELVRQVSADKSILDLYTSDEKRDRISNKMLSSSLALAPRIALVESSADPTVRLSSLRFLQKETRKLQQYCEEVQYRNTHSKAFVKRLKQELTQFKALQSKWAGRLKELN